MTTFPLIGYPYPASSQLLMSAATPSTSCCDSTRPAAGSDPATPGSTVCCPPLDSRTTALLHARVGGLPALYASPYATESGYLHFAADPSAFYSPLNSAYDLKAGAEGWSALPQPTACYPYDTYQYYGDRYGAMDLNGARRKNATRETTSTLKAWLYEHRKNPYPTKGEKIMLAIITKMTLTQVSTWFANARRRLKKENKMTWSPRNRCGDGRKEDYESDEDDDGEGGERRREGESNVDNITEAEMERTLNGLDCDGDADAKSEENNNDKDNKDDSPLIVADGPTDNERAMAICHAAAARARAERDSLGHHSPHHHSAHPRSRSSSPSAPHLTRTGSTSPPSSPTHPTPTVKPKIWSLAHTATSSSPDRRPSPGPIRSNGLSHVSFRHAPYDSPMSTLRQWVDGQFHHGIPIPRMAVHPSQLQHPHPQSIGAPTTVVSVAQSPLFSTAMTATAMGMPHGMRYPLFAHEAAVSGVPTSAVNGIAESSLHKDAELRRESHSIESQSSPEERLRTAFKPVPKR
ncbi:uncharacterized protein [Amphiura filiformis]